MSDCKRDINQTESNQGDFSILVKLQLGDDDLRWGDADSNGVAVGLLAITRSAWTMYFRR